MRSLVLIGAFLALWATSTLLLSRLRWFQRRLPLGERLAPYLESDDEAWVDDVEVWLRRQ